MPEPKPDSRPNANAEESPPVSVEVHERPEVRPLIEKAGADKKKQQGPPHGTMRTGADVPGGGGTLPLDDPKKD